MAQSKIPPSIRFHLPKENFGEWYEDQWLERVVKVGRGAFKALKEVGLEYFSDDEALDVTADALAKVFTAWNLEDNDGPLPQPWENPDAFVALANSDLNLFAWVVSWALQPLELLIGSEKN